MKKIKLTQIICLALLIMFMALPAWSLPYVFSDPIDSIVSMDTGSPSEESEKGYLADYLGITGTGEEKAAEIDLLYNFSKDEAISSNNYKDLSFGLNPGFAWDYAIVKIDGPGDYWYLFRDDNATSSLLGGDDVLTTPAQGTILIQETLLFNKRNLGVSHVTWFKPKTQVPEPATLLLLGFGLVGLAGVSRKLKK